MKQVALRISPKLYDLLKKAAKDQHRSMTAQASMLLEKALGIQEPIRTNAILEPLDRLEHANQEDQGDQSDIWKSGW